MSGRDLDLVQVNAVLPGDLARVDRVVRHRLQLLVLRPEGDRVRVDAGRLLVGEHRDDAGVQPAGQEARHRDVGDQVRGDALLDDGLQVGGGALGRLPGHVLHAPVGLLLMRAVGAEARPAARRELADALDGAPLLRHPVIEHGRDHRAGLDLQLRADGGRAAP